MLIHSAIFTGSLSLNSTDLSSTTGSAGFATTSSVNAIISQTASFATTSSINAIIAQTASFASTASVATLIQQTGSYATTSSINAIIAQTASFATTSSVSEILAKTGSYATTGSNTFIGTQIFTGSVYITSDLVVQGSSSLQNITASIVSIGTNTVVLNTATPILRFGGVSVQDSGSTNGRSGSLFWDSLNDHWINVNPSGSDEGYNSAMVINGPKNTGSLGNEAGLTLNYIPVSQGEDHITDSIIFQSGSTNIGIGTTNPFSKLHLAGDNSFNVPLGDILLTRYYVNDSLVAGSSLFHFYNNTDSKEYLAVGVAGSGGTAGKPNQASQIKLVVGANGNVGIGTAVPSEKLHVSGAIYAAQGYFVSDSSQISFTTYNGNNGMLVNGSTGLVVLKSGGNETMFLNSSGSVGIGTSPSYKLDVSGTGRFTGALTLNASFNSITSGNELRFYRSANDIYTRMYDAGSLGANGFVLDNMNAEGFHFKNNGTTIMRMPSNGNVGIGLTNPSSSLVVNGNASIGANLSPAMLPHGLDTNARALVIAGSGSNPNYGVLFLANNSTEAADALLGGVLYSQVTSGKSGTNAATKAGISVYSAGSGGSVGGFGGYMAFYTRPDNAASDIGAYERMRITSGGLLRINSTSVTPNDSVYKLSVRMTTDRNIAFGTQGGDASIEAFNDAINTNVPLRLYASPLYVVGANVKMIANGANYNENIRTYPGSNDYSSYILGAVSGDTGSGVGQWSIVRWPSANSYQFTIRYNQTDYFYLYANGNYSFYGSNVSDARKKTNITYIEDNQLDTILKLKPATFSKVNPAMYSDSDEIVVNNNTHTGFIAQDVLAENIPNVLTGSEEEGYGLDYDGILSLAVKSIQELSTYTMRKQAFLN